MLLLHRSMHSDSVQGLGNAHPAMQESLQNTRVKKSVHIETYGCQMNVSDSEIVLSVLAKDGYTAAASAEEADVVLLNTCAIRERAEQRIWSRLGVIRHGFAQVCVLLCCCLWHPSCPAVMALLLAGIDDVEIDQCCMYHHVHSHDGMATGFSLAWCC